MNNRINFVNDFITKEGKKLRDIFTNNSGISFDIKSNNTFVTQYDIGIQNNFLEKIKKLFPDDGFIGEEEGNDFEGKSGYKWIIDPIDGTENFIRNVPLFAIGIALIKDGMIIGSFIYIPMQDKLISNIDNISNTDLKLSSVEKLKDSYMVKAVSSKNKNKDIDMFKLFKERTRRYISYRCSHYHFFMLATGRADIYIVEGISVWDYAPGVEIIRKLGGKVINFTGEDWKLDDKRLIAGSKELVGQVLDVLNG